MKPSISDDERIQSVKEFLVARKNKHAKVKSYEKLIPFISEPRVKLLCKLPKTGREPIYNDFGRITSYTAIYSAYDAEKYFEWLVAVVSGTEENEIITEEIIKQANDQLYRFIDVFGEDLEMDKRVQLLAPYDWQSLFTSFDERLTEIKYTVDRHDMAIIDVLKSLLEMMKKNENLLKILQKDYDSIFPKGVDD